MLSVVVRPYSAIVTLTEELVGHCATNSPPSQTINVVAETKNWIIYGHDAAYWQTRLLKVTTGIFQNCDKAFHGSKTIHVR